MEKAQSSKSPKVIYTSLRVLKSIKTKLQSELEEVMKRDETAYKAHGVSQMTLKYTDHLTTAYLGGVSKEKAMENPNAKQALEHLGEKQQLLVRKVVFNDRIAAAVIDKEDLDKKGILYENENPHITICCKKGVKPVESNDLLASITSANPPTLIELSEPIIVDCEYSLN